MTDFANDALLTQICTIAESAGDAIMHVVHRGDLGVTLKSDESPVTQADLASNSVILEGLHQINPTIIVVSEESLKIDESATQKRMKAEYIWLVDPLDGTKEFIKGSPEFTVNIALVHNQVPILGVVYAPAMGLMYAAVQGAVAWKRDASGTITHLQTTSPQKDSLRVVASRSHSDEVTNEWIAQLGAADRKSVGSSLKMCYVADGSADVYPRFAPTMEWDTAAADAVLRVAGGIIVEAVDRQPLIYDKQDLHNPYFIAASSQAFLTSLPPVNLTNKG